MLFLPPNQQCQSTEDKNLPEPKISRKQKKTLRSPSYYKNAWKTKMPKRKITALTTALKKIPTQHPYSTGMQKIQWY